MVSANNKYPISELFLLYKISFSENKQATLDFVPQPNSLYISDF